MTTVKYLAAAACLVTAIAASAAAQQTGTRPDDPISGQWGTNGLTFLDLKFDGEKTITGTVYWRHDSDVQQSEIKSGSFDPKTNAFRIEGDAPQPPAAPGSKYVIEGKVDKDTVSGTYNVGSNNGQFTFTRLKGSE